MLYLCYGKYYSRICGCEDSVYTSVNTNVSISRIALNQWSVQQASVDIRASSAYMQEKASLFFLTKSEMPVTKYKRERLNSVVEETNCDRK